MRRAPRSSPMSIANDFASFAIAETGSTSPSSARPSPADAKRIDPDAGTAAIEGRPAPARLSVRPSSTAIPRTSSSASCEATTTLSSDPSFRNTYACHVSWSPPHVCSAYPARASRWASDVRSFDRLVDLRVPREERDAALLRLRRAVEGDGLRSSADNQPREHANVRTPSSMPPDPSSGQVGRGARRASSPSWPRRRGGRASAPSRGRGPSGGRLRSRWERGGGGRAGERRGSS
jgi:hypothetical protein